MVTEARSVGTSTIISTNPATGEVLAELACASPSEVQDAVLRARQAQPAWEATPVRERIAVLRRFQRLLSEQRDQVADLICREAGKPAVEALTTEVLVILDATEFCIRNAHDFLREEPLPHAQSGHEDQARQVVARTVWRDRHYLSLELSVLHSGHRNARGTGYGQRRRPEAVGIHPVDRAGVAAAAPGSGLEPRSHASGHWRRARRRCLDRCAHRQAHLHRQRCDRQTRRGSRCAKAVAGRAGAGRQRSHDRARRCRPGDRIQRGLVGRLHECRPDLPVGRALLRPSQPV